MSENLIKCNKHGTEYNFMTDQCPDCLAERRAYDYVLKRMTCGLCGKLKRSTTIMCGGAIGQLCEECRATIKKWEEARKRHQKRFEEIRKKAEAQILTYHATRGDNE